MKNRWVLVGLALILGGVVFIDYIAQLLYPSVDLGALSVPDTLSGTHTYNFYKDTAFVGTHTYSVAKVPGAQGTIFAMSSGTFITFEGKSLALEGLYRFNSGFRPVSYGLNVTEGGEVTYFVCDFKPGEVTTTVRFQGETADVVTDIEEGTLLVENSMPGYWEILLQSASLERGRRHTLGLFIPQAARVFQVTLFVENDLEQVRVEDKTLECMVVKASELGLAFYVHQGELVQYRDEAQGVAMNKVS
ncbi:MAG: hypothetical protein ABIJ47_07645 [Candidatus Bathyarchaeota archaeon]